MEHKTTLSESDVRFLMSQTDQNRQSLIELHSEVRSLKVQLRDIERQLQNLEEDVRRCAR